MRLGTPAHDRTPVRDRAGMKLASGDRAHPRREPDDVDRGAACIPRTRLNHLARLLAVAELAARVVAPAFDPTHARERARVAAAGGDRLDSAPETHDVDRGTVESLRANAGTGTGSRHAVSSWPNLFEPRHLTPPAPVTTQVWATPAEMPVNDSSDGAPVATNVPVPAIVVTCRRPRRRTPPSGSER